MRSAKSFFLSFLAAEWLHYRRRPPTGCQPAVGGQEFTKPVGDINRSSSNSRMRLAKGFFLPLLAAK